MTKQSKHDHDLPMIENDEDIDALAEKLAEEVHAEADQEMGEESLEDGDETLENLIERLPEFVQERINLIQNKIGKFEKEARENVKKLKDLRDQAQEDGTKLVKDFLQKSKLTREDLEKRIDSGISKILESLQIPTQSDIETLQARIDEINQKLELLKPKSRK